MGYPGWQIAKWNRERLEKQGPFKKMKDRDMTGVTVVFRHYPNVDDCVDYYFEEIKQPSNKITLNYIANLAGRRGVNKRWTYHGGGGWIPFLTLYKDKHKDEFKMMKDEVERLGGKVELIGR